MSDSGDFPPDEPITKPQTPLSLHPYGRVRLHIAAVIAGMIVGATAMYFVMKALLR